MQWPPLTGTLVLHEGRAAIGVWKGNPWWAPLHRSDWLAMGHTSKANIPEISVFYPSCHHVVGQWITKSVWSFGSRRGLLAYVYNGVSDRMNALVAGNGSYIVRPCGHDLHGPTVCKAYIFFNEFFHLAHTPKVHKTTLTRTEIQPHN